MRKLFIALVASAFVIPSLFAGNSENELLKEEIQLLKQRLGELEQRIAVQEVQSPQVDRLSSASEMEVNDRLQRLEDEKLSVMENYAVLKEINDRISINGNVDVVYFNADFNTRNNSGITGGVGGNSQEDTSDFLIDQMRLQLDIDVSEYVSGTVALLFEDYRVGSFAPLGGGTGDGDGGADSLEIDEAYITIGDEEGLYAIAGKQYFDFGNVGEYGNFINDTLARQLYETRDTGLTLGYQAEGMNANLFAFIPSA